MANEYIINYASDSLKAPFTIAPRTVDTNTTSLTLFGKGAASYGEGLQEDLVRILENFCSDTAPLHPTTGQLWYDATAERIKVYTGAPGTGTWTPIISTITTTSTTPTNPTNGQLWFDTATQLLKVYIGAAWVNVFEKIPSVADRAPNQILGSSASNNDLEFKSLNSDASVVITNTPHAVNFAVGVIDGGTYTG